MLRIQDDETQIFFKVLEYKTKHNVGIQGALNFKDTMELIPVDPSRITDFTDKLKAQVEEGKKIVTERIEHAVGQAAAGN